MEYTKGEWIAHRVSTNPVRWLIESDKRGIAYTVYDPLISAREKRDNAHLIAAAPLLVEACLDGWEMLAYWLANFEDEDHKELCNSTRNKIETIKQVLAQAEGKEQ